MSRTEARRENQQQVDAEVTKSSLPPIEISVNVACSPDHAFHLFTEALDTWWPLATHSCGLAQAASCVFEPVVGGRLYEVVEDGQTHTWGHVLVFEPPHRVAFTWHPGRQPETAQEVELRFMPTGEGTRVELVHRGWERFGEGAAEMHGQYIEGWGFVLGERFAEAAEQ
jgi:uncharacterized protein YndB with AHSA1/START domain